MGAGTFVMPTSGWALARSRSLRLPAFGPILPYGRPASCNKSSTTNSPLNPLLRVSVAQTPHSHISLLSPLSFLTTLPPLAVTAKMSLLRTTAVRVARVPQLARAASTATPHVVSSRSNQDGALLSNIEAHWSKLPAAEQYEVFQALEEAQKKDWKLLTTDEKKAGEYGLAAGQAEGRIIWRIILVRHFANVMSPTARGWDLRIRGARNAPATHSS